MERLKITHFDEGDSVEIGKDVFVDVSELDYFDKKEFIRFLLSQNGMLNNQVIINLSLLLKKNKGLTKELFTRDDIFFNDYIELLDIKQDLRKELNVLRKDIISIYYSAIKSISILNQEESYDVCNLKFLLMFLLNMEDISVISQLVDDIKSEDILYITNGQKIVDQILENSGYVKGE